MALLAIAPAVAIGTYLAHPAVPLALKAEAVAVALVTIARPQLGLLLVVAIVPLGELIYPILGARPVRHAETLILSFLTAWLFYSSTRRTVTPGRLGTAMWTFAAIVVTSALTTMLQLHRLAPARLAQIGQDLLRVYLVTDEPIGIHTACGLLEGVGLLAATIDIVRRSELARRAIALTLVASGTVAGIATILLTVGIGWPGTLARYAGGKADRLSAAQPDVNAAGSYILLVLGISIGLALTRARGRSAAIAASVVLAAALVLSGSRTAFVAAGVVAVYIGGVFVFESMRVRVALAVAILVVIVAAFTAIGRGGAESLNMRYGFTVASARMIAARPLFGVGVGRYYTTSALALPPYLAWWYGRENAHNYFLQLASELGLIGTVAFFWLLIATVGDAARSALAGRTDALAGGALAGIAAYLITCLAGHPFLVPETALPLWVTLGIVATVRPTQDHQTGSVRLPFRELIAGALLLSVAWRPGPPNFRLRPAEAGWGPWQTDERGMQFHTFTRFASLVFAPAVDSVDLPMRAEIIPPAASGTVTISAPGLPPRNILLGREWSKVTVQLPAADPLVPGRRVSFAVVRGAPTDAAAIDVGTPEAVPPR
jgi:O-Antigen ligase